ncbi:MAG TPA: MiaB/RimO family radical SAM methylthiotransferase [Candidatus Portnoybacteria bacterium]|nr:MiaB/RimO family radical SAM methylthiotransferase [Candidatus Portnoybacteria bacterium]
MKYFIITYGCQMNHSDSEKIATQLELAGHKSVKTASAADLIVINFCSVRQGAVHRALDQTQKLGNKKIIAAGCILPSDQKKLTAKNISIWHPDDYFYQAPLRQNKFSAFVPIMTGCNNFCSYCAVPFTRGREKSRPAAEIVNEIKKLLKNGTKEIILLGQNVNSYQDQKIDFPLLLQTINKLPDNFWLSFLSSHPKDMSDRLIKTLAQSKKIIPYVHLPAQSGDNKILQAMKRNYTVGHYKTLVKKLRLAFKKYRPAWPPLAITTDFIVGFPKETDQQFQNTLKLIQATKFDMIYFARYSPRPGTAAAKIKDSIPANEKRCRAQAINSLLKQQSLAINKKYTNKNIDVLIERISGQFAFGKTSTNKAIQLPKGKLRSGQVIKAKITSASPWCLKGLEKPR